MHPTTRNVIVGCVIALAVIIGIGALLAPDDEPATENRSTPTEAACDMLADGDTPDQAYAILNDILNDAATARSAVNSAVAMDC